MWEPGQARQEWVAPDSQGSRLCHYVLGLRQGMETGEADGEGEGLHSRKLGWLQTALLAPYRGRESLTLNVFLAARKSREPRAPCLCHADHQSAPIPGRGGRWLVRVLSWSREPPSDLVNQPLPWVPTPLGRGNLQSEEQRSLLHRFSGRQKEIQGTK